MAKSKKEEMVTVKIPRISKTQADEVIWVGNKRYQIRPGESVKVPESVAAVLADREYMRSKAYEFEQDNLFEGVVV